MTQAVCYVSAVQATTERRISRKFEKTQPGLDGSDPRDGVLIGVGLAPDDSDDILGLASADDSLRSALSGELGADDTETHDRNQDGQEHQEPGEAAPR